MQQHLPRYILGATVLASMLIGWPVSVLARTPSDRFFNDQWYLEQIEAQRAWDTTVGSSQLVIAVLDTGLDLDHPDLSANLWTNSTEVAGNGLDDDRNGYVDDVHGWDFIDNDATPEPETSIDTVSAASHGTLISGLIGADSHNDEGYAGVLWKVKIMPLRILNENGAGSDAKISEAIDYAVANGARVINMSFAGPDATTRMRTAVRKAYEAGVVVVAALGNDGRNVDEIPVYPACLRGDDADWVIGVAATDKSDSETDFTNFGRSCADLSAPGMEIFGLGYQETTDDAAYGGPWGGTSTASPLVAGAAGLLLAAYPSLTPTDVQTILRLSVDPLGEVISGRGSLGVGRVNVARALEIAPSFANEEMVGEQPEHENEPAAPETPVKESTGSTFLQNAHASFLAFGASPATAPNVRVIRADGTEYATFPAYAANFLGGIHVATSDFNADGVPEIVTGAGPTGGPHVRVFKAYGALMSEFFAYEKASDKGVEVAIGDVDGDGADDIVTSVGAGVSNDVIVWSQTGEELTRFTVSGFADTAPLKVAVADVDDDWQKEIVVFTTSGESRVAVYNSDGSRLLDFLAFPGVTTGVQVAVGDFNGDYRDEIVTSAGEGAEAQVRIYNKIGALWQTFATPQPAGMRALIAVTDIDVDGAFDIVVVPEEGGGLLKYFSPWGEELEILSADVVKNGGHFSAW